MQARLGDRSLFSLLTVEIYANHAGISPPSDPVREAAAAVLNELAGSGSLAFGAFVEQRERLRGKLATLLGAQAGEIALVPNTMYGLSTVALSIPWTRGDRIIAFCGEYPTNVTPFQRAAELFGLQLTLLPVSDFAASGGPDYSRLSAELARGGVRLCAVSAVQFQTGLRMPLREIAELCHGYGAELVVDAIQAAGAVPLDVRALELDYLVAGAHKWLMGTDGAGVLYARQECLAKLRPAITGNMSYVDGLDMLLAGPGHLRYDRALRSDAKVFEGGMLSSANCAALEASVDLLLGLGVAEIYEHVNAYHDLLEPQLTRRGFVSLRASDAARRSCTLSLQPPAAWPAPRLASVLGKRGIVCSCPDGLLRFSPHWPNAHAEVARIVSVVDDVIAELATA